MKLFAYMKERSLKQANKELKQVKTEESSQIKRNLAFDDIHIKLLNQSKLCTFHF